MFNFLTLSDSAKFADIARNLISGLGYGSSFNFWGIDIFGFLKQGLFPAPWVPPVMPFSIAGFFKIFGVTDLAVIATSFFYFILTLIFVFLLAKKIFKSKLVGALSVLVVGFNKDIINYAVGGASESPFIFEIVTAVYFASIKKKWANILTVIFLILMYFTRPQAFIYIVGIILYWLLNNFKIKKALFYFLGVLVIGLLIDRLVLFPLKGQMFLYSITSRGVDSVVAQTSASSISDELRGLNNNISGGIVQAAKNIFYNLYNYFKLLPEIISPYLFALFVIGLFVKVKDKLRSSFNIATLFMMLVTFLVAAASIPFFRYIHPIIPLVYIIAVGTLIEIIKLQIANSKLLVLGSCILVFIFGVGQTLGVLILDSRFERNIHNTGKPPVYVELSKILKENTNSNQTVLTNLDTWGSWYGERKTVWLPLEPRQLIDSKANTIPFDAIYLTSYMMNDENYYLGNNWRLIFENPNTPAKWVCEGCSEIAKKYSLNGIYTVSADDNYERQDAKAVLLVKK